MPGLAGSRLYVFGEEYDFIKGSEYRENMIPFIVKAEDDALAYFNRVCQGIGWREEKYGEYESWFEDITGNLPNKTQELDMRRLVGEIEPTESEIIRLLGLLDDYDVTEVGAYEIITNVLEETNETFWNIQQPGEYSSIVLQIWTRQELLEQLGSGNDALRALINLRRNP